MANLSASVLKLRAKNAGPFWITLDIFCGDKTCFDKVRAGLDNWRISQLVQLEPGEIKRYEIEDLAVVKFSFPRQHIQGSRGDRDMHGAQMAAIFADIDI